MGLWCKILKPARYVPVTTVLAGICYFALKPYPSIAESAIVPLWLGRWLDHHDFLVNLGGYLMLTAVVEATFVGWWRAGIEVLRWQTLSLAALVVGLEFSQHFIPRRVFDWQDILAGLLGVALATAPWLNLTGSGMPPLRLPELARIKK